MPFLLKSSVFSIAVPPGIGDALWSLTKVPSLREKHHKKMQIVVCDTALRRSHEFLEAFDFVDSVVYAPFPLHPPCKISAEGPYTYQNSRFGFEKYDLLLIANGHLERGHRLENWFTEIETDFTIGSRWIFDHQHVATASKFKEQFGDYAVFYLGPQKGNTKFGHNRDSLWKLSDWIKLAEMFINKYGLHILVVGAPYDKSYSNMFFASLPPSLKEKTTDLVGLTPIGLTYSYIVFSKCVISYQSGIGIFSVYLGIPTVLWWRPYGNSLASFRFISFKEEMATAWAPPWTLKNTYLPQIYGKSDPQSLMLEIEKRGWLTFSTEKRFRDNMTLSQKHNVVY